MGRRLEGVTCPFCSGGPVFLVGGGVVWCENCDSRGPAYGGEASVRDWKVLVEARELAAELASALRIADEVLTRSDIQVGGGFRDYEEARIAAALSKARDTGLITDD